ncbi:E3 ubiquitin-protein ligase HERC2 [Podospora australis]|uniref:E3 ubiquitin-protein ligase HERC2 n=1 Tax=Podospora australis TaxID=1536484 RepID=A0AAN7AG88_9PEZI|nr:E3 ubiquitin-protein ligase HERC2 [Podospora australis]
MELYATGHNPWNQLQFDGSKAEEEPEDICNFTKVLSDDNAQVTSIRAFPSYTLVFNQSTITQHPDLSSLLSSLPPNETFTLPGTLTQLIPFETGFAALLNSPSSAPPPPPSFGSLSATEVYTWGDDRFLPTLAREPTTSSPASCPGLVTYLQDLPTGPVTQIAAGGYLLAALTAGNDLYCWGHAGRSPVAQYLSLSDVPEPVIIGDDIEIVDMAVGMSHMIVLTTDGEVYVIGSNTNGQLGLSDTEIAKEWTRVDVPSCEGRIRGVAAGPKASFFWT